MSDENKRKPRGINKASAKTRFIQISLDTTKINKEWIEVSEKGVPYLNITLALKPDGEVDRYENLGMVTQKVPEAVYKAAKAANPGSEKELRGNILGNGKELVWDNNASEPGPTTPVSEMTPEQKQEIDDDLPF